MLGGAKYFDFKRAIVFGVGDRTNEQYKLEIKGGMAPLPPPWLRL